MVRSAGVKSLLTALTASSEDHLPLANKHSEYKQRGSNNSWQKADTYPEILVKVRQRGKKTGIQSIQYFAS